MPTTTERTLTYANGALSADVAVSATAWTKIWEFTNEDPNSVIYVGGKHGYFYFKVVTVAPADIDGAVRVAIADPNEIQTQVVWQGRSETLDADVTDKTKKIKLDLRKPGAKYLSKIVIFMIATSASTLDYDGATNAIYLDCTQVFG